MKLRSRMHMEPYLLNKYWGAGVGTQIKSGVRLPGTAGNYISTPDSVENSITGDIDIRVYAKLDDWTPAAINTLVAKRSATTSFQFRIETNGKLGWVWSEDGTTNKFATSSVSPSVSDGIALWVRATFDVDNSSGGNTMSFYTSADGITWTLLGTPQIGVGVTNIADTSLLLELGSYASGSTFPLAGTIYYAEVRNGIDGPIAARFDSSQVQVSGSQLPASVDGWTWVGTGLYKRDDYVRLVGGVGNYLSYPDTPANSVTGDIDIRAKFSSDDYTIVGDQNIIGKYVSVGNQRSYRLYISQPTGKLAFAASADGITPITFTSTVAPTIADGAVMWGRVAFQVASGGGNGTATFYTSTDGTVWTPLGTTVSTAYAGTIKDSTAIIEIGTRGVGSADALVGNVYYAEVRNGINGPVVASFDARVAATPWTINGSGWNWEGSSFTGKPGIALYLPGAGSLNYASTPDTVGNSVIGDIDIRAKVAPTAWSGAANQTIAAKEGTTTTRSWRLELDTTGHLILMVSTDGIAAGFQWGNSVVLPGTVDGQARWVRGVWVAASNTVFLYSSADGAAWNMYSSGTIGTTGAINDNNSPIEIGGRFAGTTNRFAGNVYYAEVRNGIDGPIVAMFDPARMAKTGTRTPASTVQPGGTPNMLTPNQASIETDTSGWPVTDANTTVAQDATQFLDGTKSMSITAIAIGITQASTPIGTAGKPVVAGKMYNMTVAFKAATTSRQPRAFINWYNAAGGYVATSSNLVGGVDNSATWTTYTRDLLAPATAAFATCLVGINDVAQAAGEVHYVDRISLVEAASVWSISGSAWDLVSV